MTKQEIESVLNYDFLYQKYIVEELSTYEICELINNIVKREKLRLRLIELGIPVRSRKQAKNTITARKKIKEYTGSKETVSKRRVTCLDRYGVDNPSKYKPFNDKKVVTCNKNLGCDYPFQNENVKSDTKKTWIEKYGVDNPNKSKIVRNRTKNTCLNRYGVTASFLAPGIREKCLEKSKSRGGYSKISLELFNSILENFKDLDNNFKFFKHGGEFLIKDNDNRNYFLDFVFIKDNIKLNIEFNGDYYHMNPQIYQSNDIAPFPTDEIKTASDIWKYDEKKKKLTEDNGFKVFTVWENDFKTKKDQVIQECINFISSNIT